MPPRLFRIYIDESGDRGWNAASSRYFVFAALIIEDTAEPGVRAARDQLCLDMGKPTKTVLHWSENIKAHPERKHSAAVLGAQDLTLSYVIVDKASLRSAQGLASPIQMHNYAARRLLERLSWYVRDEGGTAFVTFAHIKNFKYATFTNYLGHLQSISGTQIHWPSFAGTFRLDQPKTMHLLQFADVAAGCLMAAISPDRFGSLEYGYLDQVQPRIYRRGTSPVTKYGLHVIQGQGGPTTFLDSLPWWSSFPR
jgi:hypothetical protein